MICGLDFTMGQSLFCAETCADSVALPLIDTGPSTRRRTYTCRQVNDTKQHEHQGKQAPAARERAGFTFNLHSMHAGAAAGCERLTPRSAAGTECRARAQCP